MQIIHKGTVIINFEVLYRNMSTGTANNEKNPVRGFDCTLFAIPTDICSYTKRD